MSLSILLLAGCGSEATTERLANPSILPGGVTDDSETAAAADSGTDTDDGGFVLDLSGADLPEVDDSSEGGGDDGGAAGDAGADTITPTDLAMVQRSIESATGGSYRFRVYLAMTIDEGGQQMTIAPTAPMGVGEASGSNSRTQVDMRVLFESMWEQLPDEDIGAARDLLGNDLTVETIVDGTTMYLRAPMLGAIAAQGPGLPAAFGSLGDGWASIDLAKVPGLTTEDIAALAGTQGGSGPDQMLAMLESIGADTVDLGDATVDDEPMSHFRSVLDVEALLGAGAVDAADLGVTPEELEAVFGDGPTIDVYIDGDEHVRRVTMSFSADDLPGGASFSMSTTVDFFDHGADITIAVPDSSVDLTAAFVTLAGGF